MFSPVSNLLTRTPSVNLICGPNLSAEPGPAPKA